jgi:hypothetical protein
MFSTISDELEICRVMYNTILGRYLLVEKQMKRENVYKKLIRQWKGVQNKLQKDKENAFLLNEKKSIQQEFQTLREKYHLTEYASHKWVKPVRKHFGNKVNAAVAQKIATRAWNTFNKKLFGKSQNVHFLKKDEMNSFEGKTNVTGWRYVDQHLVYKDLSTPFLIKNKDEYALEILKNVEENNPFSYTTTLDGERKIAHAVYHVKFVRMVRKVIRGKVRYFADLVICGHPPSKNRSLGKGNVGLDIGTSSLAISSLTNVSLFNLAEQVKNIAHEMSLIQRKMDRSKRALNPQNYQEDGTMTRGKKIWVYSNRYQALRSKRKELHRKQAVIRKYSHHTLANTLLDVGDTFFVETMNFKALQKRKKATETSEKTGKYTRKKRFGKSLGHRAPAMFLSILEQKIKMVGGSFVKVNTQTFKASQYCHIRNDYVKKTLSQRWHLIDEETKIQRDLYAAFLLMNSNQSGKKTNRKQCKETFLLFKRLHDQEIQRIQKEKKMILNSGIIVNQ